MDANKTEILSEIMRFCKSNNMTSYYELQAYAYDRDKADWLAIVSCTIIVVVATIAIAANIVIYMMS